MKYLNFILLFLLMAGCTPEVVEPIYGPEAPFKEYAGQSTRPDHITASGFTYNVALCTITPLGNGRYRITKPLCWEYPSWCTIEGILSTSWCHDEEQVYNYTYITSPPGAMVTWKWRDTVYKTDYLE